MAAEHWFRWHHGTVTDPKWRVVAQRASHVLSQPVTACHVVSTWAAMLENASQSTTRGTLENWDDEDVAMALDMDPEMVRAIRESMQGKTLDGDELKAWKRRQPKAEDVSAASRKRAQRERERQARETREQSARHGRSRDVTTETETEKSIPTTSGAAPPAPGVTQLFWDAGTRLLGREKSSRALLGKLAKTHGREAVMRAIAATVEHGPPDPKAYLVAVLDDTRSPLRPGQRRPDGSVVVAL